MGTLTNVIKTIFTSSGAGDVTSDAERIGRAQTRLGQTSANTSRTFAAQSSGLGGLVAAYAGAAATLFAVEAAFNALNKAAQSETIIKGTNTLAANLGQSGPSILKSIQDITQGQITLTEAAQNANIALSAGFNTSQIEGFTEVAMKASRALGRDLTDSMQRVVRGVAKLEPELLDELGIFTRIDPAVQKYAKQLGVSAKSLTEFQRRQAFANAAIEEGLRKFSNIDTTSSSSQKSLEVLRVEISQLATEVTKMIVSVATPFINFLSGDIGNSLLLFGGLLAMVFSKSMDVISGFTTKSLQTLDGWAGSFVDKTSIATSEIKKLQVAIAAPIKTRTSKATGETLQGGGLSGIRTAAYAKQDPAQAANFKEMLTLQRTSTKLTITDLQKIQNAYKEQLQFLKQYGHDGSESFKNLEAAQQRIGDTLNASGAGVKNYLKLSNGLKTAVNALTIGFNFLGSALNVVSIAIGAAQLVGTLFDVDILGAVKDMFVDMSQAAEDLKNGIVGVTLAAAGGGTSISNSLKQLGIGAENLEQLPDTIRKISKGIDSAVKSAQGASTAAFGGSILSGAASGAQVAQARAVTDTERLVEAKKQLAQVQKDISTSTSSEELESLKIQEVVLDALIQKFGEYGVAFDQLFGQIGTMSGLSAEKVATIFPNIKDKVSGTGDSLLLFGQTVQKVGDSFSMLGMEKGARKIVEAGVLATNSVVDITEAMKAGAVTSQSLGTSIGGLESNIVILQAEYDKTTARLNAGVGATAEAIAANRDLGASLQGLKSNLDVFKQIEADVINLERVYKGLTTAFSKEISIFDTAQFDGLISSTGQLATNQNQINQNQADFLASTMQATKWAADLYTNEAALDQVLKNVKLTDEQRLALQAELQLKSDLYFKSIAAANGKILSIIQSARELSSQYDKMTTDIIADINSIKQEGMLLKLNVEIDKAQLSRELVLANAQAKLERLQLQVDLVSAKADSGSISKSAAAEQTNALEQNILDQRKAILDIEHANNIANISDRNRILLAEYEIAKNKITAEAELQKQKILADAANISNLISVYDGFISAQNENNQNLTNGIVDAANAAATAWATTFSNGSAAIATAISTGTAATAAAGVAGPVDVAKTTSDLKAAGETLDYSTAKLIGTVNEQTELQIQAEKDKANAAILQNSQLILAENNAYGNKIANLGIERQIEDENAKKRISGASEAGKALEKLTGRLADMKSAFQGSFESALMSLNSLIITGEGSFREIIGSLFMSIQEEVFKQTIATPLSNWISSWLVGGIQKAFSNKDILGSPLTGVVGSLAGSTGDALQKNIISDRAVDAGASAFASMGNKINNAITGAAATVQAAGSIGAATVSATGTTLSTATSTSTSTVAAANTTGATTLMSSLGPILAVLAVIAVIASLFGKKKSNSTSAVLDTTVPTAVPSSIPNSGITSVPHFAAGGMLRDRVPALLEPGEFVIRKPIAKQLGTPALQAINANGKTPTAAPVININNEGSQKEVESAKPRFDGEKYVIDIIMRDLANNGPIRKSLRGGAI